MARKMAFTDINPRDYDEGILPPEQILEWFEDCDAYWMYQGEPNSENPHAELASRRCSNGYFNCPEVLKYPNLNELSQCYQQLYSEQL